MARPLEIGKAATRIRDGAPYSDAFDDIYYSRADGLDETRYVFLAGNDLAARLPRASRFCIGETGFGTGLNFLAAWQLWERLAPADASLEFISAEKFPLDPATIRDAMAVFPELAPYTAQLLGYYPPRIPGFHRLALADGRIRLTLLFGDAAAAFGKLEAGVDAWFLDGFAPARNTAMWSDDLFRQLARLSKRGTTLATFTAAGQVRRSLEAAGFSITKRAGYAGKREMITARLDSPGTYPSDAPWFDLPHTPPNTAVHAIVIGAGIAGCSVAHALGARGATVRLIERAPQIATAASGNPAGLLMPKLTADQSLSSRFYTEAYRHTLQLLQQLTARGHRPRWNACGVLQLGFHDKVQRSHARVAERALPEEFVRVVEADEATALAGVPLPLGDRKSSCRERV